MLFQNLKNLDRAELTLTLHFSTRRPHPILHFASHFSGKILIFFSSAGSDGRYRKLHPVTVKMRGLITIQRPSGSGP